MADDVDELIAQEEKGLSKSEKFRLKISRLSDADFQRWSRYQIAKGDALRARRAAKEAAGVPPRDPMND
jgi:hypothetical protein